MSPELSKQLADMAQKFGTSASELWPILVARIRLEAIISLAFDGFILSMGLLLIPRMVNKQKAHKSHYGDSFWDDVGRPIAIAVFGLACLLALVDVERSIPIIVYPQSEALKMLFGK